MRDERKSVPLVYLVQLWSSAFGSPVCSMQNSDHHVGLPISLLQRPVVVDVVLVMVVVVGKDVAE